MSDLLIAAPLRLEARMISSGCPPGRVHRTGTGPARARAAAHTLGEQPGRALLVVGFGGGLHEADEVGEAVVAQEVLGPDGERVACVGAQELTAALQAYGLVARSGVIASVMRIAIGEARTKLREAGAQAVDMESVWLAPAARGRPFAVVRVLSDTPSHELTNPLHTVTGVLRACAILRKVSKALHEWMPGE